MFYNNGIVFQTTFSHDEINIPKLGEHISELLNQIRAVYTICNIEIQNYNKLIFETENISTIVLKLGEDSNIALFFKNEDTKELKIKSIQRYLNRIEELIDMDAKELILQEILVEENNIKDLQIILDSKYNEIKEIKSELGNISEEENLQNLDTKVSKEYEQLEKDCKNIEKEILNKKEKIQSLKKKMNEEN
ncbi:MAG: hypothetical protein JXA99_15730 [Candidatus Lokiarchaeota archaeon]|nr:hypothetical protein [Candidatus Lokiarchaeota archaeon]